VKSILASLLALSLSATLASSAVAADIVIGSILPLSAPSALAGRDVSRGIEVALEDLNKNGGLLGSKVTVITKDDESTPAIGVSRANELIAEGIKAQIGVFNSPVALAVQPLFVRANIVDITAIAVVDEILTGGGNPLAVKFSASNEDNGKTPARILVEHLRAKKIAFVAQNDVFGRNTRKTIEDALSKMPDSGASIVLTEEFAPGTLDFRNILESVRQSGADAIMVINSSQETSMPAFLQQAEELGIDIPKVQSVGGGTDEMIKVAGSAANGLLSFGNYYPEVPPFSNFPGNNHFVELYKAKYNELPNHYSAAGYLGVQVWSQAVARVGTLDREAVANEIRGGTFKGTVWGDYPIAENGQGAGIFATFVIEDGKRKFFELGK
jgi:branched-chain amino acid transport system substrate-binding protein